MPNLSTFPEFLTSAPTQDQSQATPGSNSTTVHRGSNLIYMSNRESLHYGTYTPSTGVISDVTGVNSNPNYGKGAHTGWGPYFSVTQVGTQNINLWRFKAPHDGKFQFCAGQSIMQYAGPVTSATAPTSDTYWTTKTTGNNTAHLTHAISMTKDQYMYFNCANTRWTYNSGNTGGAGTVKIYYTEFDRSLCSTSSFDMGAYGENGTFVSHRSVSLANSTSTTQQVTLNLRIDSNAHAQFKPIIQDMSGSAIYTGNWWDINHNTGTTVEIAPGGNVAGPAAGSIITIPVSVTIPANTTMKLHPGSEGRHNGDYNYGPGGAARFVDIDNCVAAAESIANNPPNSLFFCNTAEGLQVELTDLSSDADGVDDIRKWEFEFNASGKYYGETSITSLASVTSVLTFDADLTTDNTTTATFAGAPPASFKYRYDAEGTRDIELTVTDDAGATDVSQLPSPYVAVSLPPTAAFTTKTYRDNRDMDLTDNSDDLDGVIVTRSWDMGDGTTTTRNDDSDFTHTYASDGAYTVVLTVTDNIGKTGSATQIVDIPRTNSNIVFVNSGPVSPGFTTLSATSAINTVTDNYEGPCFRPWYRTIDVIGTNADDKALAFNQANAPMSIKTETENAQDNYKVDFMAPSDGAAPFKMSEWLNAEIPPPAISTPNPPGVDLGGGLFSVGFDSNTYFKTFIDTSGSMNSYVSSYQQASNAVSQDMKDIFFNGDDALARKYVKPYVNISNERWGTWAMSTLYESTEPKKQVIIAAINEDSSGGQGTGNAAILAKAQAMFDAGGHYFFILIAPPGGNAGGLFTNGPALAATRVTVGGQQVRWCQWSRESSSGGALSNVIRSILGFNIT